MSKAEILEQVSKLSKEERDKIRYKLAELDNDGWLDEDDPLTEEDKPLIDKVWPNMTPIRNWRSRGKRLRHASRKSLGSELSAGLHGPRF